MLVQSTWFQLIGRDTQTLVDIPTTSETDYRAAEHRVHCTTEYPSHIRPSVVP